MASGVNRKSDARMLSIGDDTFESSTLESLFEELRSIGMEGRYEMPKRGNQLQYVICGVFSRDEIESSGKYKSHIEKFTKYLLDLNDESEKINKTKDEKEVWKLKKFGSKFMCIGRFAVLLNNQGRHGEARLFDPDGSLLCEMGIRSTTENAGDNVTEKRRYLDEIKQRFVRSLGARVEPYIVLLSHLVPCTEPGYECARLIREYVERTKDKIIISYDCGWQGTNMKHSLEQLTHDSICVVKPRERRAHVNKEARNLEESCARSNLKRVNSCEEELLDDADLVEDPKKRKTTSK